MKRWLILAVCLLVWSIVLVACGSESQGSSAQGGNQGGGSPGTTPQSSGAKEVHIVLTEMKIESDVTTFTHGVPYHFTIQNKGKVPHEFTITKVMKGDATEQQRDAASLKDMDHINPGQIQTLDYTFADAAPPGTLEFECAYPNHYQQGMHLGIVVE